MTEKERVKRAIRFRETDLVPWQIDCTSDMARIFMERHRLHGGGRDGYNRLHDYLGNHLAYLRTDSPHSTFEESPGIWRDEWGVLWDRSLDRDIGSLSNCILEHWDVDKLAVPDPCSKERYTHFEAQLSVNENRYKVAKISRCLFERAWSLRGMENLLVDFVENPAFVHELFGIITDFGLGIIEALKPFPIDAIRFSDDWGGQRGMLMSPDTWRRFIKPYLARLYAKAHAQGYDVFIHCCGNILDILDDLIEIGVNVFNPIQPETMDVEDVIKSYAGRLAFNGGLSIQHTLPFGTPSEVREEVENRVMLAKKHGGYIVAPSHDMPPDIPVENIDAMCDVLFNQ
jgi:uroporphyrinogen decarboxylase